MKTIDFEALETNFENKSFTAHNAVLYENKPYTIWQRAYDWVLWKLYKRVKYAPLVIHIDLRDENYGK